MFASCNSPSLVVRTSRQVAERVNQTVNWIPFQWCLIIHFCGLSRVGVADGELWFETVLTVACLKVSSCCENVHANSQSDAGFQSGFVGNAGHWLGCSASLSDARLKAYDSIMLAKAEYRTWSGALVHGTFRSVVGCFAAVTRKVRLAYRFKWPVSINKDQPAGHCRDLKMRSFYLFSIAAPLSIRYGLYFTHLDARSSFIRCQCGRNLIFISDLLNIPLIKSNMLLHRRGRVGSTSSLLPLVF